MNNEIDYRFYFTPTEYRLFSFLLKRKTKLCVVKILSFEVYGFDDKLTRDNIKYIISLLRKKIKEHNLKFEIKNIRGYGYLLKELDNESLSSSMDETTTGN